MSTLETMAMEAKAERAEELARNLASENERLRDLLAIARAALDDAVAVLVTVAAAKSPLMERVKDALHRSDPDVQPESGQ